VLYFLNCSGFNSQKLPEVVLLAAVPPFAKTTIVETRMMRSFKLAILILRVRSEK